jgi:diguanylate cyclase (GGDEF)-like protein
MSLDCQTPERSRLGADIRLLGYVAASLFFSLAVMLMLTLRQAGRVRGSTQWLWGTLVIAIGVALNTAQESIVPLLGVVVSNVLLIAGAAITAHGSYEYRYHRRLAMPWGYFCIVACAFGFAYFVYIQPSVAMRVLLFSLTVGLLCTWHAWVLLAGSSLRRDAPHVAHKRFRLAHGIMIVGLLMMIAVLIVRFADTLQQLNNVIPPGGSPRSAFLFYATGLIGRVLLLIGMVLVLIDELDHTLRDLALRDPLTALLNRRGFMQAAQSDSLKDCSLLMLDLDRFKAVNDDFGHEQGDVVIALFARCAIACLPKSAVLGRLGGEEFCALLPNTDIVAARAFAETLREGFARETAALDHGRQHTVSVGMVSVASSAASLQKLMALADSALYRAKNEGRNRVAHEVSMPS